MENSQFYATWNRQEGWGRRKSSRVAARTWKGSAILSLFNRARTLTQHASPSPVRIPPTCHRHWMAKTCVSPPFLCPKSDPPHVQNLSFTEHAPRCLASGTRPESGTGKPTTYLGPRTKIPAPDELHGGTGITACCNKLILACIVITLSSRFT